jgi:glucose 1-dehydrogenase
MKAVTVVPGVAGSLRLDEIGEPRAEDGALTVDCLQIGICGTDQEIAAGGYGWPPEGSERLVIGHESLGRVRDDSSGRFSVGDFVVGIVRRPDPLPCSCCARGEWDMCENGDYTERGIKRRDGYASERFRLEPEFAVAIDPGLAETGVLMEPTSIVAKAWEQVDRIGTRACFEPRKVLVTGAGPIGLLAALLAVQRGLEVTVLDQMTDGPKPAIVEALGATYRTGSVADACANADVVIEATGVGKLIFDAIGNTARNAIICLTGVSSTGHEISIDAGVVDRRLVLGNEVVFGSVNANRRHYEQAAAALKSADHAWLESLITRRVPLSNWREAYERRPDDVKVVLEFATAG